jgi:hypothetical protein
MFIDYSKMQDDGLQFMDLQEENAVEKALQTEKQAKELIMDYLVNHNYQYQ